MSKGTGVSLRPVRRGVSLGGSKPTGTAVANVKRQPDLSTFRGRLGAAVRTRREKLGLSQAGLVELLEVEGVKVSVPAISAYETGTRAIQVDDIPAFAAALKTTVRKLIPDA